MLKIKDFFLFINLLKNERSYKKTIALSKKRKVLLKNDRGIKKNERYFSLKKCDFCGRIIANDTGG